MIALLLSGRFDMRDTAQRELVVDRAFAQACACFAVKVSCRNQFGGVDVMLTGVVASGAAVGGAAYVYVQTDAGHAGSG
jgi:hypothetical protein